MSKRKEPKLFFTAQCKTEGEQTRTFYVYGVGVKTIEELDPFGYPKAHLCHPRIQSIDQVIKEIENIGGCRITSIKKAGDKDFKPYKSTNHPNS